MHTDGVGLLSPCCSHLCSLYREAKSAVNSERRGWKHVEISQEDGGCEGQDLSKRGHAAPFLMTKLGGRMSEALCERGSISAYQASWREDKLKRSCCQIYLTSSCLINPVGRVDSRRL